MFAFIVLLAGLSLPTQTGARFGHVVSSADVNGDGFGDVLVAEPWYDGTGQDVGRVLVFHGSPTGPAPTPDWTYAATQAGARLGEALAGVGDLNGDGYDDVVVGAPAFDRPPRARVTRVPLAPAPPARLALADAGLVLVFAGSPTGLSAAPVLVRAGSEPGQRLGASVARAGDLNGDGYGDFVVGATGAALGLGAVRAFHGSHAGPIVVTGATVFGAASGERFGFAVGGGGDVNGDGFDDVVVGAPDAGPSQHGAVSLFLGGAAGLATTPADTEASPTSCHTFTSEFGCSVTLLPRSPFASVVIGDEKYDGPPDVFCLLSGTAYLYAGGSTGLSLLHTLPGTEDTSLPHRWGISVAAAGRVNLGSAVDLVVGATTRRALLFLSPWDAQTAPVSLDLNVSNPAEVTDGGWSVSGAGDVDGDGFGDVAVSEPLKDTAVPDAGRVRVFRGKALGANTTATWILEAP